MAKKQFSVRNVEGIKGRSDYRDAVGGARRAVFIILGFSFLVFVAIAIIAVWDEGVDNFVMTVKSINPLGFAAALAIIFFSYSMRYPKWSYYLKRLGVKISTGKNFLIYMSMYSMDITPGRWGRAIVSYTINRLSGVKFARTFPAVVADIFTDFLGFAIITDATAIIVGKFVLLAFIITGLLMVPFFFVYYQTPFDYVKRKFRPIRRKFDIAKKLDIIFYTATLYFQHNKKLGKRSFIYSMLLTVPSMFLNGMALYVIIWSFGVPIGPSDIAAVLFIFSSSLVLGMITGIPGTLGVTDAALITQLQYFFPQTITFGIASAITIFFRIASVWFVEGFGFGALLYTLRYWD